MCHIIIRLFLLLFIFIQASKLYADEIPIIVISAGKTTQSYSSVGSQVTIIDPLYSILRNVTFDSFASDF